MAKKSEYRRNAIDWQLIGHQAKTERTNLFLTFVVATIGFASSVIWLAPKYIILKHCIATPLYFFSILLLFGSLFTFFSLSNHLKEIAFEYSTIQGNIAHNKDLERNEAIWGNLNQMHKKFYKKFDCSFYVYIIALIFLIVSILITVYVK
ncbi:hypothetical protein [Flavobacterium poyangense]|uniref:hypothetical protein n=1 Tax=Flavobacterium poyangense TaxID=2204302 RepID=UPI00141EC4B7|nr:hypothetical protein [Flavobacterium sp. JXAS1]